MDTGPDPGSLVRAAPGSVPGSRWSWSRPRCWGRRPRHRGPAPTGPGHGRGGARVRRAPGRARVEA